MGSRTPFLFSVGSLLLLLAACDGGPEERPLPPHPVGAETLTHGGLARTYQLFVPDTYQPSTPAPLLLAFHGQTSYARNMQATTDLDDHAAPHGMLVAYLDDAAGDWAEGCNCTQAEADGVDDLGFARAVVAHLQQAYTIDPDRLYATGFSIGGLMTQRLACEASDLFAAVAIVSATMSTPLSQACQPQQPISVLVLHGTADPVFPWQGLDRGNLSTLGAEAVLDLWRGLNGCTIPADTTTQPINTNLSLRDIRYAPCQAGTEVRLLAVEGGIHAWYRGAFDVSREVVGFFERTD